jgi:serine/threonine kinase 3
MEISAPKEFQHIVHVDKDFNWSILDGTNVQNVFRQIRLIGEGGFGSVYEMEHLPSGARLAGKSVKQEEMTKQNKNALAKEIDLLRKVTSPYTVNYYGTIMWEDNPMILMQFCNRGSLRDIMDSKKITFSENQISVIMHDILMALNFLHNKHHILHRDIKAANILVTSNADIMLSDFGISRQFDASKTMQTVSCIGTPYWMAPEILNDDKYTFPADIWSTGITAVELAEGQPPYSELSYTKALIEISTRGFPGFKKGSKYTKDFVDFVNKCIDKDPKTRAKPEELLQHPFIKRADKLDRSKLFKRIVKDPIDYQKLLMENEEEEDISSHSTREILAQYTHDVEIIDKPIESELEKDEPCTEEKKKENVDVQNVIATFIKLVKEKPSMRYLVIGVAVLLFFIIFRPSKLFIFTLLAGAAAAYYFLVLKKENKDDSK